jgi:hypothetical protein
MTIMVAVVTTDAARVSLLVERGSNAGEVVGGREVYVVGDAVGRCVGGAVGGEVVGRCVGREVVGLMVQFEQSHSEVPGEYSLSEQPQFLNASSPIAVTVAGISALVKLTHK